MRRFYRITRRTLVQVARTLVIRDQLRATKLLVCGENIHDFCHSCREQPILNMFDIFCHSCQKFLVCGKQLIATFRSKDVRMLFWEISLNIFPAQ
jgi:hypothetical protein